MKLSQLSIFIFYLAGTVIATDTEFEYSVGLEGQQPLVDTNRIEVSKTCPIPKRPPHGRFWDNDNGGIEEVHSDTRQTFADPGVGSQVTVKGTPYLLNYDSTSPQSSAKTYRAAPVGSPATVRYAKRPVYKEDRGGAFAAEVSNTQKASNALGIQLYYSNGVDPEFQFPWLITYAVAGNSIVGRWTQNPTAFKTRAACVADFETAKKVIATKQKKLAMNAATKFLHDDSHLDNWYVPETGTISNVTPIDFGKVRSMAGLTEKEIDEWITKTMNDQYKVSDNLWAALGSSDCGSICK